MEHGEESYISHPFLIDLFFPPHFFFEASITILIFTNSVTILEYTQGKHTGQPLSKPKFSH